MEYIGTLRIVRENEGTKSEGDYAYLEIDEDTKYRLYEPKHLAMDTANLKPLADQQVKVDGEMEEFETICINSITQLES